MSAAPKSTAPRAVREPAEPVANLGGRLRDARELSGLSLREVARRLGVSASFVSQLENGKAQPSVATLYALATLLGASIDELFAERSPSPRPASRRLRRADLVPVDAFLQAEGGSKPGPVSVTRPGGRARLEMESGVVWERLVADAGGDLDFIEIVYPPSSSSTGDGTSLRHDGTEYGVLLAGRLEVTVGGETFVLRPGDAIGFDSSEPHLFHNPGRTAARGIWCVRHRRATELEGGKVHG